MVGCISPNAQALKSWALSQVQLEVGNSQVGSLTWALNQPGWGAPNGRSLGARFNILLGRYPSAETSSTAAP